MDSVPTIPSETVVWRPDRAARPVTWTVPSLGTALWRGVRCRCPACGLTRSFRGYLRVVEACSHCGAPLGSVRADDAPPYFTILIVGHIVVPSMLLVERAFEPSDLVQAAIWIPVTTLLCLGLLRPIKGATLGLMLKLGLLKDAGDA